MTAAQPTFDRCWLAVCALATVLFLALAPPIAQDQTFHRFADERSIFGVPNFWNVITNLPFALVGIAGLARARRVSDCALFAGVLFTCAGSAWYHLAPSDASLVWDRLPMTVIFMSFVACVLEEERLLLPLLTAGVGSVLWWQWTGDLRLYAIVKFGPMLLLLPAMASALYRRVAVIAGLFGVAQLLEVADRSVWAATGFGGHGLKHLVAGVATALMLRWRTGKRKR